MRPAVRRAGGQSGRGHQDSRQNKCRAARLRAHRSPPLFCPVYRRDASSGPAGGGDQVHHGRVQLADLFTGQPQPGHHDARDFGGLLPKGGSARRQPDVQGAFVSVHPLAGDESGRFQAAQQRRDGGRLLGQGIADVADRARARFPQAQHDEVLRVRQSELVQDGFVGAHDAAGGHRQCEAELLLQQEVVLGCQGVLRCLGDVPALGCSGSSVIPLLRMISALMISVHWSIVLILRKG